MNKKMMLSVLGIVAVSSSAVFAGTDPGTGVVGSIHDMTQYGGITESQGRVCAFCHTPHHAMTATDPNANDYLPLWSHALPDTTNYKAYDSATIDATINATSMMEGPSKLCMSCHDGAIAVDTHYATTGTVKLSTDGYTDGGLAVGTASLSNDHPIGFIFDATDIGGVAAGPAEGEPSPTLVPPAGQDKWIRSKEALYLGNPSGLKIKDRLYLGTTAQKPIMTCATCHDVHNKKSVADGSNHNYLLLSPNTGSKLCITCHIK
jgi:nitrate/TMAO reductase-like tetraheme cytochrome c subunit